MTENEMASAGFFGTIYSRAGRTSVSVSQRLANGATLYVARHEDWNSNADALIARVAASGVRIEQDARRQAVS